MHIRSSEFAWQHFTLKILGRTIVGNTGYEFKKEVTKEPIYGAGQTALDIQEGPIKCSGSINLLGFEQDKLEQAAIAAGYDSILQVPHELITLTAVGRKTVADPIISITAVGVSFTETTDAQKQGDMKRDCTLPFICMDIIKTII